MTIVQVRPQVHQHHSPTAKTTTNAVIAPKRSDQRCLARFYQWKNAHQYLGRYSIDKLLAFQQYQSSTSLLRAMLVILLTPMPSLLVIYALAAMPLANPLDGPQANWLCFIQSGLSYIVMTFALLLFFRQALGWTDATYSQSRAFVIASCTAICNELVCVGLAYWWRFPVPFRDLVGFGPFFVWFPLFHWIFVRDCLRQRYKKLLAYLPLFTAQASLLFIFQAIAIMYQKSSYDTQMILTLFFPLIKAVLKRCVWHFAKCLNDITTEITVCVVEIFGSLYQNMCIQSVQSLEIAGLMIFLDFVQALLETKMYLGHKFVVDGRQAIPTALKVIEAATFNTTTKGNDTVVSDGLAGLFKKKSRVVDSTHANQFRHGSSLWIASAIHESSGFKVVPIQRRATLTQAFVSIGQSAPVVSNAPVLRTPQNEVDVETSSSSTTKTTTRSHHSHRVSKIDELTISHQELATLLQQTLQLLFATEVLCFTEFIEVAMPFLYGLYSVALYQLPSARYNLTFLSMNAQSFTTSIVTTAIYCGLELVSFIIMCVLVQRKYGLSVLYQLAFVLETYWMSVQGKLMGSLVIVFMLTSIHHGVDPSLEFDWIKVLNGTSTG